MHSRFLRALGYDAPMAKKTKRKQVAPKRVTLSLDPDVLKMLDEDARLFARDRSASANAILRPVLVSRMRRADRTKTWEWQGEQRTVYELAEIAGISVNQMRGRLYSPHFTVERAVTEPVGMRGGKKKG